MWEIVAVQLIYLQFLSQGVIETSRAMSSIIQFNEGKRSDPAKFEHSSDCKLLNKSFFSFSPSVLDC